MEKSNYNIPQLTVSEPNHQNNKSKTGKFLNYTTIFLLIFTLIFLLQNILFIIKDTAYTPCDWQIGNSIDYYHYFFRNPTVLTQITYPPVTYIITSLFYTAMGISTLAARLSLIVFWIIFILAMFGIGKELGGIYSGIVITALAASSPQVLRYSRIYFLDFPQAATTALALYFLIKSKGFKNRKYAILFGFSMATTLLTKWAAGFFMIIPVLWFLIPVIFKSKRTIKAFFVFLIYILISSTGTILYYRHVMKLSTGIHLWFWFYIINIIIPSVICFFVTGKLNSKWKDDEKYPETPSYKMINFIYSMLPVIVLFGFWLTFAGRDIGMRYFNELTYIKRYTDISSNFLELFTAFKTMINFSVVFLVTGIIYLFISKKKTDTLLLFLINSLISLFLVIKLATFDIAPPPLHSIYNCVLSALLWILDI